MGGKAAFTRDHKVMYRYKPGLIFRKAKIDGGGFAAPFKLFPYLVASSHFAEEVASATRRNLGMRQGKKG